MCSTVKISTFKIHAVCEPSHLIRESSCGSVVGVESQEVEVGAQGGCGDILVSSEFDINRKNPVFLLFPSY